jgi:hypothetical protein
MTKQEPPARTLERKKREAAALKANMKRRKEQVQAQQESQPTEPKQ